MIDLIIVVAHKDARPRRVVHRRVAQVVRVRPGRTRRRRAQPCTAGRRLPHQHVAQEHAPHALMVGQGIVGAVAGLGGEVDAHAEGAAVCASVAAVEALSQDLGDAVGGCSVEELVLVRVHLRTCVTS